MENNFKTGDIVWCKKKHKYLATGYHVRCVVGEVGAREMKVCILEDLYTEDELFYPVEKCDFEKCNKISATPKSTNKPFINLNNLGEGEIPLPADYEYKVTLRADGLTVLEFDKIDNTKKIENWKKATRKRIRDTVDSPKYKKHSFNFYTAGKFGIAIGEFSDGAHTGIARWNGKDKWDADLSQCIAFSRLLGWDIPNFIFGK